MEGDGVSASSGTRLTFFRRISSRPQKGRGLYEHRAPYCHQLREKIALDDGGVSRIACRPSGSARSTREGTADVHSAVGSLGRGERCWEVFMLAILPSKIEGGNLEHEVHFSSPFCRPARSSSSFGISCNRSNSL